MTIAETGSGADDARRALDRALRDAAGRDPYAVSVPAPAVDAERAFGRLGGGPSVLFQGRDGLEIAGWGIARRFTASGENRFRAIAAEASRYLSEVASAGDRESLPAFLTNPRAVGGLAFAPGAARTEPWTAFGDACFVVPRWTYVRRGAAAALTLVLGGDEEAASALGEAEPLLRALETAPDDLAPPRIVTVAHLPEARWAARVDAILAAIREGAFEKIVAARRSVVEAEGPIDAAVALSRLRRAYASCTRFAFRTPSGLTFLGATPERLVAVHGLRVETEALAGTRPSGLDEHDLLGSAKDAAEHAPVVRRIGDRLAPFCGSVGIGEVPELRRLPNLVHIRTAIQGKLRQPTHVLALADALHPTPAVGGVPEPDATAWIQAHEEHPRGWYAGPFGWIDGAGDGELVVALRSGLFAGARAYLYAGGGIVDGSEPGAEWAETELKLRPMLEALGHADP